MRNTKNTTRCSLSPQRSYPSRVANISRISNTSTYHLRLGCLLERERMNNMREELSWGHELPLQRPWGRNEPGASGSRGYQRGWNKTWNQACPFPPFRHPHKHHPPQPITLCPWLCFLVLRSTYQPQHYLCVYSLPVGPLLTPHTQQRLHKAGIWWALFPAVSSDHRTVTGT